MSCTQEYIYHFIAISTKPIRSAVPFKLKYTVAPIDIVQDARHWCITHCDMSKSWVVERDYEAERKEQCTMN